MENPYDSPETMARFLLSKEGFPTVPKKVAKVVAYLKHAQEISVRAKQTDQAKFWRAVREEVERVARNEGGAGGG